MLAENVRLFLDKKSLGLTNETATLRWFVVNQGDTVLRNIQVSMRECLDHPDLSLLQSRSRTDVSLAPGEQLEASSGLKIRHSLRCPLEVQLSGLSGSRPFVLVSRGAPSFSFERSESRATTQIDVEGAALIKNLSGTGALTIKVGKDALIKDLHLGKGACVQIDHAMPSVDDLIEIQLCQPEIAGLYPLDLDTLVAHWPNRQQGLSLTFVDKDDRPITQAFVSSDLDNSDLYRARLMTVSSGYLTLISQGASGKYCLLCPNPQGIGLGPLAAHRCYFFPGQELHDVSQLPLEEQEWTFGFPTGTERLLALLTTQPLWPEALPVLSTMTQEALVELFCAARQSPSSEVSLAKIETKEVAGALSDDEREFLLKLQREGDENGMGTFWARRSVGLRGI